MIISVPTELNCFHRDRFSSSIFTSPFETLLACSVGPGGWANSRGGRGLGATSHTVGNSGKWAGGWRSEWQKFSVKWWKLLQKEVLLHYEILSYIIVKIKISLKKLVPLMSTGNKRLFVLTSVKAVPKSLWSQTQAGVHLHTKHSSSSCLSLYSSSLPTSN